MINDKLIEYAREKIPDEFRSYLNEKNNLQCASFISSTQNELRIMKAHKENTKFSGLKVNGLDDLIIALENFEKENVFVINVCMITVLRQMKIIILYWVLLSLNLKRKLQRKFDLAEKYLVLRHHPLI